VYDLSNVSVSDDLERPLT